MLKPVEFGEGDSVIPSGLKKCPAMQFRAWPLLLDSCDLICVCALLQREINDFPDVEDKISKLLVTL